MEQGKQTVADLIGRLRVANAEELKVLERALASDTRITLQRALATARARVEREEAERARIEALYQFERSYSDGLILGLDEVGRGPLAGPLAVGAVVLDSTVRLEGLNDSKQIPEPARAGIAEAIRSTALAWTVVFIEPSEIDAQGMAASLRKAFSGAIAKIEEQGCIPDCILLDGNPLHLDEREINVVKGDTKSASIAAASVLAKVERDAYMVGLARDYPAYGFERNKGYASQEHTDTIRRHGLTPQHRASFCSAFLTDSIFSLLSE